MAKISSSHRHRDVVLVVLVCLVGIVKCGYYNSNVALLKLFVKDAELTDELSTVYNRQPSVQAHFASHPFLKYIVHGPLLPLSSQTEANVNNPLNQYLLLWRFHKAWPTASKEMNRLMFDPDFRKKAKKQVMLQRFKETLVGLQEKVKEIVINDAEVKRGAKALLRLQETYHLKPFDLIHGSILNYTAARALNDEEALWVLNSAESLTDNCGFVTWGSDMLQSKMHVPANYLTRIRTTSREEHCDKYYCTRDECTPHDDDSRNYIRLCNEKSDYNGNTFKSSLKCFLYAPHAALILQPVKTEKLSADPVIYKFHQLVTDVECDQFWATSDDSQADSFIGNIGQEISSSEIRVGTNAWIKDGHSEIVDRFNKRVHQVSGLKASNQEEWQVASYGIGGHYWFHHDDFENGSSEIVSEKGNRLATLMIYLSDVEVGGATAFPRADVVSFPEKGNAVFWFSLDTWEQRVEKTLHGGCPVLIGSKKIGNKWIRYKDQFSTHKCYENQRLHTMSQSLCKYN